MSATVALAASAAPGPGVVSPPLINEPSPATKGSSMTLDEVRRSIYHVRHQIRCVLTDQDRDVKSEYVNHWQEYSVYVERLRRLRERYYRSQELIERYEQQAQEHRDELKLCQHEKKVRRMVALVARANGYDKRRTKSLLQRYKSSREKVTTLRYLIEGFENEIKSIEKLCARDGKVFYKREEELLAAVNKQARYWERFLRNRVDQESVLLKQYALLDQLLAQERDLGGDKKLNKLSSKAEELMALMKTMPRELVAMALELNR